VGSAVLANADQAQSSAKLLLRTALRAIEAVLQQLRTMQHNSNVTDSTPDPPATLNDAEKKFITFRAFQNYPEQSVGYHQATCW